MRIQSLSGISPVFLLFFVSFLSLGHCTRPPIVEIYGLNGIGSINGFDLFLESLGRDVEIQRKGFLEASFFEDQDVVLYLDRYGDQESFSRLIPFLNRLNLNWENEESDAGEDPPEEVASLLILLKDTTASLEAWRKIALDMPAGSKARRFAEELVAYQIYRIHYERPSYVSVLGLAQEAASQEGRLPNGLPLRMEGPFPVLEENWRPMKEWYSGLNLAEKDAPWVYLPHWRSRIQDKEKASALFGDLPDTLPVRRSLSPAEYIGYGPHPRPPNEEIDPVTARELENHDRYRQGNRTIIAVQGKPVLVRIQYGRIPVYILAGSEPFLNWHMATEENRAFLSFLLHAVSEGSDPVDGEQIRVTSIERGLVPAEQMASQERSLIFLFLEEPWGIILSLFILVLIVFIWSRYPHERTPLEPEESGTRRFREHFEAMASRMIRSRNRLAGLGPLVRYKKKRNPETVFPELNENQKLKEEVALKRVRDLWE